MVNTDFQLLKPQVVLTNEQQIQAIVRPDYRFHSNFGREILCEDETTDSGRTYVTPEGHRFPSITTMLSKTKPQSSIDSLKRWRKSLGEAEATRQTTAAATRGTKLHKIVENFITNVPNKKIDDKSLRLFKQISKYLPRIGEVHIIEQPLYSQKLKIAGRVDLISEFDGKLSVIDFKSSTKTKEEEWILDYLLQETFYSLAFGELFKERIEQIVTIIAVENSEESQIFIKKPVDYVGELVKRTKEYYSKYPG